MLRVSANISTLFTELPVLERPGAAANAGFAAVEMQFPYEAAEPERLAAACKRAGVEVVLLNLPAGDRAQGQLGLAGVPGAEEVFADGLEEAIRYARALGCTRLNALAGNQPPNASADVCRATLIENLRRAAGRLDQEGIALLTEPLNRRDHPDFLLAGLAETDALLAAVNHANLSVQYDAYHMFAAGEDWLGELPRRIRSVGHIQFSDFPGRHEPGVGIMDMPSFFALIDRSTYAGWTGAEYRPSGTTAASFGWRAMLAEGM